jgi:hypothetical protein
MSIPHEDVRNYRNEQTCAGAFAGGISLLDRHMDPEKKNNKICI